MLPRYNQNYFQPPLSQDPMPPYSPPPAVFQRNDQFTQECHAPIDNSLGEQQESSLEMPKNGPPEENRKLDAQLIKSTTTHEDITDPPGYPQQPLIPILHEEKLVHNDDMEGEDFPSVVQSALDKPSSELERAMRVADLPCCVDDAKWFSLPGPYTGAYIVVPSTIEEEKGAGFVSTIEELLEDIKVNLVGEGEIPIIYVKPPSESDGTDTTPTPAEHGHANSSSEMIADSKTPTGPISTSGKEIVFDIDAFEDFLENGKPSIQLDAEPMIPLRRVYEKTEMLVPIDSVDPGPVSEEQVRQLLQKLTELKGARERTETEARRTVTRCLPSPTQQQRSTSVANPVAIPEPNSGGIFLPVIMTCLNIDPNLTMRRNLFRRVAQELGKHVEYLSSLTEKDDDNKKRPTDFSSWGKIRLQLYGSGIVPGMRADLNKELAYLRAEMDCLSCDTEKYNQFLEDLISENNQQSD